MKKKEALETIINAGNRIELEEDKYSCVALMDTRDYSGAKLAEVYWVGVFNGSTESGEDHTVFQRWQKYGWKMEGPLDPQLRDHRLIMLAWFHEMIRSGEFDLNFK